MVNTEKMGPIREGLSLLKKTWGASLSLGLGISGVQWGLEQILLPSLSPDSLNESFALRLLGILGLSGLFSLLGYLTILSRQASALEGRPWTWSVGLNHALSRLFRTTGRTLWVGLNLFSFALLGTLLLTFLFPIQDKPETAGPFMVSVGFLVSGLSVLLASQFVFLPQVSLLEDFPGLKVVRRISHLSKGLRLRILGILVLLSLPSVALRLWAQLRTTTDTLGPMIETSDGLWRLLGAGEALYLAVVIPLLAAFSTVYYYRQRRKEVNIEA